MKLASERNIFRNQTKMKPNMPIILSVRETPALT